MVNPALNLLTLDQLAELEESILAERQMRVRPFVKGERVKLDSATDVTLVKMHPELLRSLDKGKVFFVDNGVVYADSPVDMASRVRPETLVESFADVTSGEML